MKLKLIFTRIDSDRATVQATCYYKKDNTRPIKSGDYYFQHDNTIDEDFTVDIDTTDDYEVDTLMNKYNIQSVTLEQISDDILRKVKEMIEGNPFKELNNRL